MGSHAKQRTTGRRTALGALAVGATLTGVGLTAAALDPATAVLTADAAPGNGAAIQLSGLADPVALGADPVDLGSLTSAPPATLGNVTGPVNQAVGAALDSVGGAARNATSGTVNVSTAPAAPATRSAPNPAGTTGTTSATTSGQSAIRPIQQSSGVLTDGYIGRHRQTRAASQPAVVPSVVAPLAEATSGAASSALSTVTGLAAKLPVVSSLVGGTGVDGTASGLLGTATATVGGTVGATSAAPVSGLVGSVPLVGRLTGGSGSPSALTLPGLSAVTGLVSATPLGALTGAL